MKCDANSDRQTLKLVPVTGIVEGAEVQVKWSDSRAVVVREEERSAAEQGL